MTTVKFSLVPGGKAPVRATEGAAAFDLFSRIDPELVQSEGVGSHERPGAVTIHSARDYGGGWWTTNGVKAPAVKIPLGVCLEIPPGHFGMLCARSSLGARGLVIPNGLGVIDSDYRGEVSALYQNFTGEDVVIRDGDRIAQIIILPLPEILLVHVDALSETVRGTGGFGSTGLDEVEHG